MTLLPPFLAMTSRRVAVLSLVAWLVRIRPVQRSMRAGRAMSGSSPIDVRSVRRRWRGTRASPPTHRASTPRSTHRPARSADRDASRYRHPIVRLAWRSPARPAAANARSSSCARTPRGRIGARAARKGSCLARLEEGLPFAILRRRPEKDLRSHRPLRAERPAREAHVGLFRRSPSLAQVANAARRHEVLPRVRSAPRTRKDVVDVELAQGRLLPAILALVCVPKHQVSAGQAYRRARGSIVAVEVEHTRDSKRAADDR
jgi:hypothetical protein